MPSHWHSNRDCLHGIPWLIIHDLISWPTLGLTWKSRFSTAVGQTPAHLGVRVTVTVTVWHGQAAAAAAAAGHWQSRRGCRGTVTSRGGSTGPVGSPARTPHPGREVTDTDRAAAAHDLGPSLGADSQGVGLGLGHASESKHHLASGRGIHSTVTSRWTVKFKLWHDSDHLKKRHPAISRLISGYPGIIRTVTYPGISQYKSG